MEHCRGSIFGACVLRDYFFVSCLRLFVALAFSPLLACCVLVHTIPMSFAVYAVSVQVTEINRTVATESLFSSVQVRIGNSLVFGFLMIHLVKCKGKYYVESHTASKRRKANHYCSLFRGMIFGYLSHGSCRFLTKWTFTHCEEGDRGRCQPMHACFVCVRVSGLSVK